MKKLVGKILYRCDKEYAAVENEKVNQGLLMENLKDEILTTVCIRNGKERPAKRAVTVVDSSMNFAGNV